MKSLVTLLAGTVLSAAMLAGPADAQQQMQGQQMQQRSQQGLNPQDVRQYIQRLQQDISQIMQSGNVNRLRQWTQNNVADGAVFSGTRAIWADDQRKAFVSATLDKQDLLWLQRFALSSMPDFANRLEDYNLSIEVTNIQPIGDSAALVTTQISESGSLSGAQQMSGSVGQGQFTTGAGEQQFSQGGQQFGQGQSDQRSGQQQFRRGGQQFGQAGQLSLETEATCSHVIQRSPNGGRLQIGMSTCTADTTL